MKKSYRNTGQYLLPEEKPAVKKGGYDIYPTLNIGEHRIFSGFESLAELFSRQKTIIIEGYSGVFFDDFRQSINVYLKRYSLKVKWISTNDFIKPESIINKMIAPYTGNNDPVFGKRAELSPEDFFDIQALKSVRAADDADITIIIGPGSSFTSCKGLLVFLDLPKNEIQFRSRAGSVTNLGASDPLDPKEMYRRFYFIDWIVLNKLKQKLLPGIDIIVDTQRPDSPAWMSGDDMRSSLMRLSRNFFRVRPWFEPGTWGGTWMKDNIEHLNKDVPNYAWSFELIVPENGLLFESSGKLLEVSFDFLMYQEGKAVLGDCFEQFGTEFPVRFDYLDTFDGGNLSIQCHPRPGYMKENFGENFTQEETYYILDTKEDAVVYLGFRDDIDPAAFRRDLEKSFTDSVKVDIEKFVQKHTASKHDLFLIPYGTIHGSGKNNLVLEISSTPYIFTFKMYDWLRPDLDGKPRPLNIARAMDNLFFDRKGAYVKEKLISRPELIKEYEGGQLWHLPTHETHLYDVHRFHIRPGKTITVDTLDKCHILNLVDGSIVTIETGNGTSQEVSYAETFVIPAAAGSYRIINNTFEDAILVKAFVK